MCFIRRIASSFSDQFVYGGPIFQRLQFPFICNFEARRPDLQIQHIAVFSHFKL